MFFYLMGYVGLRDRLAFIISDLRAKRRQVEQAEVRNREEGREKGRLEGLAEGREIGRAERGREMSAWYDQFKELIPDEVPPPPGVDNGAENGHKEQ